MIILGHYNFTFMLGDKGFNELDMALFKHLIHNKKECCFVRTQCDSQINGMLDRFEFTDPDMTAESIFEKLQTDFKLYMEEEVISQTKLDTKLGLLFFQYKIDLCWFNKCLKFIKDCYFNFQFFL